MRKIIEIARALSDENRVRALMLLNEGELCVCQIIEMLGLAPSTVSKHMSILKQADLVQGRKEGRWIYYRLAGSEAGAEVKQALKWVRPNLMDSPQVRRDQKNLQALLKIGKENLCRRQRES